MSTEALTHSMAGEDLAGIEREVFSFGPFKLFPAQRLLERSGQPVKVGGRAFDILVLLIRHASEVVTQRQIHATVWSGLIVDEGSLRFHVSALRKALGDGQPEVKYVVNVPGRGYCFVAPVTRLSTASSIPRKNPRIVAREGINNLPPPLTRMVGRSETVHDISVKLLSERFVTIVGPGGMGKTTVAIALGHSVLEEFAALVRFVDLGNARDSDQIAAAIAVAIGLHVRSDDIIPGIVEVLRPQHTLLILDSCEHVLDAVTPFVEQIFVCAPEVFILATCREPLGVEGEHVFRLPPLRSPPEGVAVTAQELQEYSAPQLFLERARAGGTDIELSNADVETVIAICRRLDGVALAIELAAGRVQAYGINKTAALLGHQFSLLWPGRRTALPRHQTLMATLDWSYNLLSPAERRLLYRLSIFIGAFDLEAVKMVAQHDAGSHERRDGTDVSNLVAKSLAMAELSGTEVRYRLLDTTRHYGLQKLMQSGELDEISRQHAKYYEQALIRHSRAEQSVEGWHRSLAPNINDIRAAMDWALSDVGDVTIGVRLAAYSASLWLGLELLPECRERMERAAGVADQSDASSEEKLLVQMALGSTVMFTIGLGEAFRTSWTKVLSLSEEVGDIQGQLTACLTLWAQQIRTFNVDEAAALAQRCTVVAHRSGRAGPRAMSRWMLGLCEHHLGRHQSARHHLEDALASDEDADRLLQIQRFGYDRRSDGLSVLSNVLWMQGQTADALEMSAMAVSEARHHDYPVPLCVALSWHCFNLYVTGAEWSEIDRQAAELIGHSQRYGIEAYHGLGLCLQALSGKPEAMAEDVVSTVVRGAKMLVRGQYFAFNPILQAEAALVLADAGLQVHAESLFAAMTNEDRNPDHWGKPEIVRIKGRLALSHGNAEEAERCFRESIDWASRHGSLAWQLRSANSLAGLWIKQGRQELVADLLGSLIALFRKGIVSRDLQTARALIEASEQESSF